MTKEDFSIQVTSRQSQMYRIARSYMQGEHDCLDAISETILKAWQKKDTLRDERYFGTWLCRILVNECVNTLRKQKRIVPVENIPDNEAEETDYTELRQALDALPQKYRVITVLHYMEGYSVKDAARILHLTRGTASSRLYYAREQMRAFLKEEMV